MGKSIENSQLRDEEKETKKLAAEELEARVALSVPGQKKSPSPVPYPPGTRYGLVKRSNMKEKDTQKLTAEELEARVALSVPSQKKTPSPSPYAPGTLYGLVKRSNL